MLQRTLAAMLVPWLAACTSLVPPPELPDGGLRPRPLDAWASVLHNHVDDEGRIDFDALAASSEALGQFIVWIAENGPRTTPGAFEARAERVAYYVNAYNALAMWNVLRSGELPAQKVRFFYFNELKIDGGYTSLYTLENDVIRTLGDARVHFALNCMVRSCPRLPREPFLAPTLDAQLDAAAREFFADERNVRLDPERQEVRFNAILDFYTEDFLAQAPSLIAYANRYRDDDLPEDYEVGFLEYDWTLNAR